jgi:putative transposase
MNLNRAHLIQLKPTAEQKQAFAKACGTARFTYNWALACYKEALDKGEKPNIDALKKQWNASKPEWVYESPKDANQQPFTNLKASFSKFFSKLSAFPSFKKKGQRDSFYVSNDKFSINGKEVRLPVIGKVKMTESLRFEGKIQSGTVSRKGDKWFLSISVQTEIEDTRATTGTVGIDLGIKSLAVLSDKTEVPNPKPLKTNLQRLHRLQKAMSRKLKGSKNWVKSVTKLRKLYYKISCVRNDNIHKATTTIAKNHGTVVVETLGVSNMLKNSRLSRAISDCGFYEFKRQLLYKCRKVVEAPRFYPSSKTCSGCGNIKDVLLLSERTYKCTSCSLSINRDLNAAINLSRLA